MEIQANQKMNHEEIFLLIDDARKYKRRSNEHLAIVKEIDAKLISLMKQTHFVDFSSDFIKK